MPEERNMYNSLRLSAGGGLNHTMEKVPQAEDTATIAIGIGGTGLASLRMLKKTIYERVKQDNYEKRDTEAPIYNRIKFLFIDLDDTKISNKLPELDFSNEFENIGIPVPKLGAMLGGIKKVKAQPHLNWLNVEQLEGVFAKEPIRFVGGTRQLGRLMLFFHARHIYDRIKSIIVDAIDGLPQNFNLNIYVMTGLCGGTGSGCFIDVCYIIRQVLEDLGYESNAVIVGLFYLPDVNLSDPDFPLGGPCEAIVKENGYAALKELDYLMNLSENGDVFEQQYDEGGFKVGPMKIPPVDFCHLLSTKTVGGAVIDDGYNYVLNVVAEYILNFVVKSSQDFYEFHGSECGINLWAIAAKIYGLSRLPYKQYGANYVYTALGASCATVPYREICTYLAIRFFESIKYITKKMPRREDVQTFCRRVGLEFDRLDMDIKVHTPVFNLDPKNFDTKALKAASVGDICAPLGDYCDRWKNSYANQRGINIKIIGRELSDYIVSEMPTTMARKVFNELINITGNPNLGPYFAANMLQHPQNHTIASEVAGIRERASKILRDAQKQTEYRLRSMNDAQSVFRSATLDPFEKKKREYVYQVELWYRNRVEIETYTAFINLMDTIQSHLDKMEEEFFKKYTRILDKLIRTFDDNSQYFYLNNYRMDNRMYTWSIVDIEDIKDDLDAVVAVFAKKDGNGEVVAPYLVQAFNKDMLNNIDKWFDESEIKISELINNFIRNEFSFAMSKTMKQYLEDKYQQQGCDLINTIERNVIYNGLVVGAEPMFDMDPLVIDVNDYVSCDKWMVLNVPNTETYFAAAALQCKRNGCYGLSMTIVENALRDRMFLIEFFGGIPLYAYRPLKEYERIYYAHKTPGTHLYESREKDWSKLPSPIPATYASVDYTRADQGKIDKMLALYEEAKILGVITEDAINNKMVINIFNPIDFDEILSEGWNATEVSCNDALKRAETIKDSLKESIKETIEINSPNFERTHLDKFVYMPVYVEKVREEVEKLKKLDGIIEEIKNRSQKVKEDAKQRDFIRALLHSVIIRNRSNYKFSYEKRGEIIDVMLTSGHKEYAKIPVYQAYLGYLDLDQDVLDLITQKTDQASLDITDEIYDSAKAFQDFYKDVRPDYMKAANDGSHLYVNEIVRFLNLLYDSADQFIRENQ